MRNMISAARVKSFLACVLSVTLAAESVPAQPMAGPTPFALSLPSAMGFVSDSFASPAKRQDAPDVVIIQDLHVNRSVQFAISRILGRLSKAKWLPEQIGVEGAVGPIEVKSMQSVPSARARKSAADYLLRQGEMPGDMHYVVTTGKGGLYGIETQNIYDSIVGLYRQSYPERATLRAELDKLRQAVRRLARDPDEQVRANSDVLGKDIDALDDLISQKIAGFELKSALRRATQALDHLQMILPTDQAKELINPASAGVNFYMLALMRDKELVKNLLQLRQIDHQTTSVMVVGGFHTPGIVEQFKKQNISYVVITPNVRRHTKVDEKLYVERMLGHHLTPEQVEAGQDWASELVRAPLANNLQSQLFPRALKRLGVLALLAASIPAYFATPAPAQTPEPKKSTLVVQTNVAKVDSLLKTINREGYDADNAARTFTFGETSNAELSSVLTKVLEARANAQDRDRPLYLYDIVITNLLRGAPYWSDYQNREFPPRPDRMPIVINILTNEQLSDNVRFQLIPILDGFNDLRPLVGLTPVFSVLIRAVQTYQGQLNGYTFDVLKSAVYLLGELRVQSALPDLQKQFKAHIDDLDLRDVLGPAIDRITLPDEERNTEDTIVYKSASTADLLRLIDRYSMHTTKDEIAAWAIVALGARPNEPEVLNRLLQLLASPQDLLTFDSNTERSDHNQYRSVIPALVNIYNAGTRDPRIIDGLISNAVTAGNPKERSLAKEALTRLGQDAKDRLVINMQNAYARRAARDSIAAFRDLTSSLAYPELQAWDQSESGQAVRSTYEKLGPAYADVIGLKWSTLLGLLAMFFVPPLMSKRLWRRFPIAMGAALAVNGLIGLGLIIGTLSLLQGVILVGAFNVMIWGGVLLRFSGRRWGAAPMIVLALLGSAAAPGMFGQAKPANSPAPQVPAPAQSRKTGKSAIAVQPEGSIEPRPTRENGLASYSSLVRAKTFEEKKKAIEWSLRTFGDKNTPPIYKENYIADEDVMLATLEAMQDPRLFQSAEELFSAGMQYYFSYPLEGLKANFSGAYRERAVNAFVNALAGKSYTPLITEFLVFPFSREPQTLVSLQKIAADYSRPDRSAAASKLITSLMIQRSILKDLKGQDHVADSTILQLQNHLGRAIVIALMSQSSSSLLTASALNELQVKVIKSSKSDQALVAAANAGAANNPRDRMAAEFLLGQYFQNEPLDPEAHQIAARRLVDSLMDYAAKGKVPKFISNPLMDPNLREEAKRAVANEISDGLKRIGPTLHVRLLYEQEKWRPGEETYSLKLQWQWLVQIQANVDPVAQAVYGNSSEAHSIASGIQARDRKDIRILAGGVIAFAIFVISLILAAPALLRRKSRTTLGSIFFVSLMAGQALFIQPSPLSGQGRGDSLSAPLPVELSEGKIEQLNRVRRILERRLDVQRKQILSGRKADRSSEANSFDLDLAMIVRAGNEGWVLEYLSDDSIIGEQARKILIERETQLLKVPRLLGQLDSLDSAERLDAVNQLGAAQYNGDMLRAIVRKYAQVYSKESNESIRLQILRQLDELSRNVLEPDIFLDIGKAFFSAAMTADFSERHYLSQVAKSYWDAYMKHISVEVGTFSDVYPAMNKHVVDEFHRTSGELRTSMDVLSKEGAIAGPLDFQAHFYAFLVAKDTLDKFAPSGTLTLTEQNEGAKLEKDAIALHTDLSLRQLHVLAWILGSLFTIGAFGASLLGLQDRAKNLDEYKALRLLIYALANVSLIAGVATFTILMGGLAFLLSPPGALLLGVGASLLIALNMLIGKKLKTVREYLPLIPVR